MAKECESVQPVLRPASGRQLGAVRKSLDKRKWSARFKLRRGGQDVSMDGPARVSRCAAEKDRELIAATMCTHPGSSKMEAASAAMKCLRSGKVPVLQDGPGSASTVCHIGADELASMGWAQLRKLVNQTPGITKHTKNKQGRRATKSNKELKEDLLALKNFAPARVQPGRKKTVIGDRRAKKRPAGASV